MFGFLSSVGVSNRKEADMDWWILELITVGVMIAVVGVLGPLIKRFGKAYAADVFRANPRTGKSYLVLMDFAYYMIFGAYVLFVIKWEPDQGWEQTVNAERLQGFRRTSWRDAAADGFAARLKGSHPADDRSYFRPSTVSWTTTSPAPGLREPGFGAL